MRIERFIYSVLIFGASLLAIIHWRKSAALNYDNELLREQLQELRTENEAANRLVEINQSSAETLKQQTKELMQLRNQVTQLRSENKDIQTVRAENQQLKNELGQRRSASSGQAASTGANRDPAVDVFPRERWTFAGYASPESALVSAIWAMKEGNPETYLNSLSPQEQERMARVWQEKTETEIAEKHRNDVSAIAGLRVLERQNISPTEVVMNVMLEGPGRVERIRMNQVGQEWKFGGFIREQQAAGQ